MCGKMLTLGAVLRSGAATPSEISFAFGVLLEISSKRSYLGVASIQLIVDHLQGIEASDFADKIWPVLSKENYWKGQNVKIETLWLLLEISAKFPKIPPKSYVQEHFGRKKFLSDELASEVADVLMVS